MRKAPDHCGVICTRFALKRLHWHSDGLVFARGLRDYCELFKHALRLTCRLTLIYTIADVPPLAPNTYNCNRAICRHRWIHSISIGEKLLTRSSIALI